MSSFRADNVLEKMEIKDPDFRYMAVSDLYNECQKEGFKLDAESERKIVAKLLYLIGRDLSGDVKSMAVKCLAPLATKITDAQFTALIDGLSGNIFSTNKEVTDETKDISTIGLKYIIAASPDEKGTQFVTKLGPKLTEQIQTSKSQDVVWFCLDIVNDILGRWGKAMAAEQNLFEKLQVAVLPHLTSDNTRARKKAIGCLGYLCLSLPENLLNRLCEHLIEKAKKSTKKEHAQTFVQALAAVCRSADKSKLGPHISNIMNLLFKDVDSENEEFKDDEELKDNCFQCMEALLTRCPKETDKYFDKIQAACLKFISWDPILIDDDDEEQPMDEEDEQFIDGGEFLDDDSASAVDDDDMSWKVRKAATKCIYAIVKTRPEKLNSLYDNVVPTLIKRFKEREENVKLDIMVTVGEVLRQTHQIASAESDSKGSQKILKKLTTMAPEMHKSVTRELTSKSPKAKIGAFQLLRELANVLPESFKDGSFVEGITQALADKSPSPLKIEALSFLRVVLSPKTAVAFLDQLPVIVKAVYSSVNDVYYKITAEALRVCGQIVKTISNIEGVESFDNTPYVGDLYAALLPKLKQVDVDLEVKDGAIETTGLLISLLGSKLQESQINECLEILCTRLSNEVTRLGTVRTIDQIAKAKFSLGNTLGNVLQELSGFLRKKNRQLKQATLSALYNIVRGKDGKSKAASAQYENLLKELAPIVSIQDLHLAHLSLQAIKAILHASSSTASTVKTLVLPNCNEMLVSPVLQGVALQSMLALFKELTSSKSKKISYESLLEGLTKLTNGELSKQSYNSIAQCIAVLVAANEAGRVATVTKFVSEVKSAKTDNQKLLALYCIAEIGTRTDISGIEGVKSTVLASFESPSEEIKSAGSVAFGCIACCNMAKFLPEILAEVKEHPKRKYLLLGSLREVIVRLSGTKEGKDILTPHFEQLLGLLFEHTSHEEEGTRNVVSECLGKLALVNPEPVILALRERTKDANPLTRACVTAAIKFTIFEKALPVDKVLAKKENITAFLDLLSDPEINVRKSVMVSLNYCAHHKASIIRDVLPKYLPQIYDQSRIKPELIREVELGPFKHKEDGGLETRQATFECMYTLLETCLTRIELQEFISKMVSGLGDEYDIQMLNHLMLIRLAKKAGSALLGSLELLIDPLKACVTSVAKDANVPQLVERNNELIKSALRAIAVVNAIPDLAETTPKFQDFMKTVVQAGDLGKTYGEIIKAASERS